MKIITFELILSIVKDKKLKRRVIERLKGMNLGDYDNSESIKLEIDPGLFDHDGGGTGGTPVMGEPITIWMDDLNDPNYTLNTWIVEICLELVNLGSYLICQILRIKIILCFLQVISRLDI